MLLLLLRLLLILECVGLLVGVGELEAPDVILIKSIALKRVDHECRLEIILEVSEAENDLLFGVNLPGNQPDRLESLERSEDVYIHLKHQ